MSKEGVEPVCGVQAVNGLVQNRAKDVLRFAFQRDTRNPRVLELIDVLEQAGVPLEPAERKQLDAWAKGARHQGIIAWAKPLRALGEKELEESVTGLTNPLFLVLDSVEDPHNLGACLRVADGAGAAGLIIPKDHAAPMTALVRRVAAGAAESIPVYRVTNLARTLQTLQSAGVWVIGTSDKARKSIYDTRLNMPLALVMGAEQKGLRQRTESICDELVYLPMRGSVSSLNVSVAAGICCYEAVRQRNEFS